MNQSNVSSQGAFDFICARFVFFEAVGDLVLEIVGCSAGGAEVEDAEEEGGFGVEGWWHSVFLFCFVLFLCCVVLCCVALRFLFLLLCLFCDGMIVSVVFFFLDAGLVFEMCLLLEVDDTCTSREGRSYTS